MQEHPFSYLFVYGTLQKEADNEMSRFLQKHSECIGKAYFYGKLYQVSWYPAAVLSTNISDKVYGMVFKIFDTDKVFKILDDYEGIGDQYPKPYLYRKEIINAFLKDNSEIKAWVYIYNLPVNGFKQIVSGDFFNQI